MTQLIVVCVYLALLVGLGVWTGLRFRGTSKDYFVASRSIGPFLLLMSVFGTTMTGFALVGSTGKAYERGIGTYGLMASSSGLIHAAIFFLIGAKLWTHGKRHGYVTQIQFFRDRFESNGLGYLLFPILVGLVVPYLLISVLAAGSFVRALTAGAFPETFLNPGTPFLGGVPIWLTGLVISVVVLIYVFMGGSRGTIWANTFQTLVFMVMGVLAFVLIASALGGPANAAKGALEIDADGRAIMTHRYDAKKKEFVERPTPWVVGQARLTDAQKADIAENGNLRPHLSRTVVHVDYDYAHPVRKKPKTEEPLQVKFDREHGIPWLMFLTYMFIPFSVGMFPHLFQNWLTAKSAKTFRLTVVAHPIFIMIVWVPCVLIGVWASGVLAPMENVNATLGLMVKMTTGSPLVAGLLGAGVLAAIMSSLDSQFLCLGTIFTNDIVLHRSEKGRFTDAQIVRMARGFIVAIVVLTYILAMIADAYKMNVFDLAVWCFSGFGSLFPLVFCSLYWRRTSKEGAFASVISAMTVWFIFFAVSGFGGEYTVWGGVMPAALCFAASLTAIVVVSLATPPPSDATLDKFFPKAA